MVGAAGSAYASSQAADAQKDASKRSSDTQRYMYNQSREDLTPYRESGYAALDELKGMLGLGRRPTGGGELAKQEPSSQRPYNGFLAGFYPGNFETDPIRGLFNGGISFKEAQPAGAQEAQPAGAQGAQPAGAAYDITQTPGYQFRFSQGLKALDRSAAAGGTRLSGRAIKAAQRFGSGLASQEFGNRFNRLSSLAGLGQVATNTGVQAGANAAGNISAAQLQAGNATAAGYVGAGNALNQGLQNSLYAYTRYGSGA